MDSIEIDFIERVANLTRKREIDRETWERAVAIEGLLAFGDLDSQATANRWIDQAVRVQDSTGQLGYNDRQVLAHGHVVDESITTTSLSAALGYHVVGRWQATGEQAYLDAARRQADALSAAPRSRSGGISIRHEQVELWVDTLFMVCPFLARLASATGERAWLDECLLQLDSHTQRLLDSGDGLLRHAWRETPNSYPQSTFWSRGNAWFIVSFVDSVASWGSVDDFGDRVDTFHGVLANVLLLQDASGLWRNELDDPASKLEISGSLMFAYAIAKGVGHKIVDESLLVHATRAFRASCEAVGADGEVRGVTIPPGGPNAPFGVTSYGQGFFLSAYSALKDVGALPERDVT